LIWYAGPLAGRLAKSPDVTVFVQTIPQAPPWQAVFTPQLVTALPHWPHELHVT
jgi:hypothetical protein